MDNPEDKYTRFLIKRGIQDCIEYPRIVPNKAGPGIFMGGGVWERGSMCLKGLP